MQRHTRLSGGLAAAALTIGTSAVAVTMPAAQAAEGDSPLRVFAKDKVTAYSYDGWVYSDLGLKLIAPDGAFEVRSHRTGDPLLYDGPIQSFWTVGDSDPTAMPAGTLTAWNGLPGFLELHITRLSDGKELTPKTLTTCLNSEQSQRTVPSAPARSPYPTGCPWNPWTLGSVMGVQSGHAVPAFPEWMSSIRLKPGRYDVEAHIADQYADMFGILPEDASATTRVRVISEEFERPTSPRTAAPSRTAQPAAEEPSGSAPAMAPGNPLPDLRSLPAWSIGLNRNKTTLRFAANVWNAGDSPLVVDGFRTEQEDHMDAYQYFFDADGNQVSYTPEPIGEMNWHAENHNHWHFEDFATYNLLDESMSQVVKSTKQSFCLAATDAVDYTVEGADWHPQNTDLRTACDGREALSLRQVLPSGSGDTYFQYRYGQAFPIKDLPNGSYWIQVLANPIENLVESDYENNASYRLVKLRGTGDNRRVVVPQLGVVDEYAGGMFGRH